jgi:peptide/nickel transport system ATP-binding protein
MRLHAPSSTQIDGKITFMGQQLLELPEGEMRGIRGNKVAMIFQDPMTSLNPTQTVGDHIAEVLRIHRGLTGSEARTETLSLLDRVRIPSAVSRFREYPHQLSGGMRQRIMIAMALACRPRLLIADEPTTALDVTIQAQILELIKILQDEEDMAVLFITHDLGVVAEVADRTVVMYQGQAIEHGSTEAIFTSPQMPYTRALLASVPRLGSMAGTVEPRRFPQVDMSTGELMPSAAIEPTVQQDSEPLLQVQNLTTRFGVRGANGAPGMVHAVEDVSFILRKGETLALVGESGCGKSTTVSSVMRLTEPTHGSIKIAGEEITKLRGEKLRAMRRNIQMVFQDPFASLNPRMTVGQAIAAPLVLHGLANWNEARDRVAQLLQRVGLKPDMAGRFPHEFSGGQRQRLCIARALAITPKIIVADEAVSALDVSIKAQVINLMLDLQQEMGLSYLFISHDMAVVERMSHRVGVMYLGEIVEIGPRSAIFEDPQHPYTRKLLAAVPVPDPAQRRMRRGLSSDEIRSPVRDLGYVAPKRAYREVTPGHFVQEQGPEWAAMRGAA